MSSQFVEHKHDTGIDIYHFKVITRAAIDEFFNLAKPILTDHIDQYQDTLPVFYAFDLSKSGMFPVAYMMKKAVQLTGVFDYHPVHYVAYVLANTQDKMLVNIMEQVASRDLAHTRKVFKPDELNLAIDWLKETRATFL